MGERICCVAVDRDGLVVAIGTPDPQWLLEQVQDGLTVHQCSVEHARGLLFETWRPEPKRPKKR